MEACSCTRPARPKLPHTNASSAACALGTLSSFSTRTRLRRKCNKLPLLSERRLTLTSSSLVSYRCLVNGHASCPNCLANEPTARLRLFLQFSKQLGILASASSFLLSFRISAFGMPHALLLILFEFLFHAAPHCAVSHLRPSPLRLSQF